MDPATAATFLSDRGDAKVALHGGGIRKEVAGGAESRQEPRRHDRSSSRQFAEKTLFRVFGKSLFDRSLKLDDMLSQDTQFSDQHTHDPNVDFNHG